MKSSYCKKVKDKQHFEKSGNLSEHGLLICKTRADGGYTVPAMAPGLQPTCVHPLTHSSPRKVPSLPITGEGAEVGRPAQSQRTRQRFKPGDFGNYICSTGHHTAHDEPAYRDSSADKLDEALDTFQEVIPTQADICI